MQAIEPELRAAIVAEGAAETRDRTEFGDDAAKAASCAPWWPMPARAPSSPRPSNTAPPTAAPPSCNSTSGSPRIRCRSRCCGTESKTRAVTPAPGDVGTNQQPIIPAVFPQSCAAFLGVDMPTVGVGEAVFPVLTTSAVVGVPAEGAVPSGTGLDTEGATTGAFAVRRAVARPVASRVLLQPRGPRAVRRHGRGVADEPVRSAVRQARSTDFERHRGPAERHGLGESQCFRRHVLCDLSRRVRLWPRRRHICHGHRRYRMVVGSATYGHMAGVFRSNNAGDRAALEDLMNVTGGVKVSAHVPALIGRQQAERRDPPRDAPRHGGADLGGNHA